MYMEFEFNNFKATYFFLEICVSYIMAQVSYKKKWKKWSTSAFLNF